MLHLMQQPTVNHVENYVHCTLGLTQGNLNSFEYKFDDTYQTFLIQLPHMPDPNTRGSYFESLARG